MLDPVESLIFLLKCRIYFSEIFDFFKKPTFPGFCKIQHKPTQNTVILIWTALKCLKASRNPLKSTSIFFFLHKLQIDFLYFLKKLNFFENKKNYTHIYFLYFIKKSNFLKNRTFLKIWKMYVENVFKLFFTQILMFFLQFFQKPNFSFFFQNF